jgi:hypothetical protein
MNTVIVVVIAVGVTFFALAGIVAIGLAYWEFRKNLKILIESAEKLAGLSNSLRTMPHLCEGIINICKDLSENAVSFSKSVNQFRGDLFPGGGRRESGFQPYSDDAASAAYRAQEMVEFGLPPDLARQKADATGDTFTLGG